MTINNIKIIACPYCLELYKKIIYGSINNFNSVYYSDGEIVKGNTPDVLGIVKCINNDCSKFFKIKDAEVIDELDFKMGVVDIYENAYSLSGYKLGAKELQELLELNQLNDSQEEIKIRTCLLRRYNDVYRVDEKAELTSIESQSFYSNSNRLIELLKDVNTLDDKLFVAEIHKEIGEFEKCIELLNEIENDNLFKEKIFSQAKIKDKKVFNIVTTALKNEYKCNNCGDSLILFNNDIDKSVLEYKHYKCLKKNKVFDAPSKERNPVNFYRLSFFQKLFKSKVPYEPYVQRKQILCKCCNSSKVEEFLTDTHKCVLCGEGSYSKVKR